jgi:glycosyltransferase involved in cell wall biosynthesis
MNRRVQVNILYLTISTIDLKREGLYQSLILELINNNHNMTLVVCSQSRDLAQTILSEEYGIRVLRVRVGNQFGVSLIKKGITTLKIQPMLIQAINKYLPYDKFDLVLYATPPVTFDGVVSFCKKKYNCKSYLMLKDIFPQNAADIGIMKKGGLLYRYFRMKEKKLYILSDFIGCMSQKNIDFILKHNPWLTKNKVELFPNTIKINTEQDIKEIYSQLDIIPPDKTVFIFGGNLGKPQGVVFLLNCISELKAYEKAYFFIVGNGTEKSRIEKALEGCSNAKYIGYLPKNEYDRLMKQCDVGLILLDKRFTIPNYPSRTLDYMSAEKPILAATDKNTDIRELLEEEAKCGKWCYSGDETAFIEKVKFFCENEDKIKELGCNGRRYLEANFDVKRSVEILEKHFN